VDAFTPVDLNASYAIGDQEGRGLTDAWVIGLDISNIFDEDPPYVNIAPTNNGSGGYDATASNPVGRLIGVMVSKRF
jgi:iron complex outermembrane receptor protein